MPKRDAPAGAPCWVDLSTSDTDRARSFYGEVLGWEAEDPNPDFGGYFNFTKDGVRVAGCMAAMPGGMPDVWSIYLAVDDAAATVDKAKANGANVFVEPMPVGDLGVMAVMADSGGAAIGMWQPGEHEGFGLVAETGAPSWFELYTRDYEKSLAFYEAVFGWTTESVSDTPEFRYSVMAKGDEQYAGVADATTIFPPEVPAHWTVYFGVDDTDAALEQIVALGGSVVQPAEDTPYGRLAAAADPMGARFRLVAPNEEMPAKP